MLTRAITISTLTFMMGGCVMDVAEEELDEVGEVEEGITQGQLIPTNHQWAVKLKIEEEPGYYQVCSGVVLSEHWVLTAAHCVDDAIDLWDTFEADRLEIFEQAWDGALSTPIVYGAGTEGAASFYIHPDYDGSTEDDIALVRLYHAGIAGVQKGRFWYDNRAASNSSDYVWISGFGQGSYAYQDTCHGSFDGRGREGRFTFNAYTTREARADSAESTTCLEDAGGPWWVRRGGRDLVIGVQSGTYGKVGEDSTATLIGKYRWQWIIDKSVAKGIPLSCSTHYTTDGFGYKLCSE